MNRNTTLVLVAAFGLLVLYLIFVQRPKEQAALNATPTPGRGGTVWALTSDQIVGLRLTNAAGQTLDMQKDGNGLWALTEPEARLADQNQAANAITQLIGLSYSQQISATDLSAFGVLSPTFTLDVTLADGTHKTAAVGNRAPVGSTYYLQRGGETDVLLVSTYGIDTLTALIATPPIFVPTPEGTPTQGFVLPSLTPVAP